MRNDRQLKLEVSAWAKLASAKDIQYEQSLINSRIPLSWEETVRQAFVEELESSLRTRGAQVTRAMSGATAPSEAEIVVNAYLTAGFVYKTWTSSTYVPFVHVVLGANTLEGRPLYRRLLVASSRPFNPLMNNISPADNAYAVDDLESLSRDAKPAIDSLASLASQLARAFSLELVA